MSKKSKYRYPLNMISELFNLSKMDCEVANEFMGNIDIDAFKGCLSLIDPTQVSILRTKYEFGKTIKEAGAMMGMSSSTASKEKVKAFAQLRSHRMKARYIKE